MKGLHPSVSRTDPTCHRHFATLTASATAPGAARHALTHCEIPRIPKLRLKGDWRTVPAAVLSSSTRRASWLATSPRLILRHSGRCSRKDASCLKDFFLGSPLGLVCVLLSTRPCALFEIGQPCRSCRTSNILQRLPFSARSSAWPI